MQADTYIPRRLDDPWKIGFWDIDVAAPVILLFLCRLPVGHQAGLCGLRRCGDLPVALDRPHQGRQAPGLRDALAVLAPAAQPHDRDARHPALAHPPHGRLSLEHAMDFERINSDIKEMRRRNRSLGLAVGVLASGHVVALLVILNLIGTVRTVVVPPTIDKTFWVSRDKASGEYLEQMGGFMAWLVLDVTPSSIDWKKNILLGYVEPDQYGALKTRQEVEAERLKRINAATMFMPQQLVPSEDKQSVVVRGRLRTLVNGFETANDLKAYLIEFSFNGARMHLKTFKEVPNAS